MLDRLTVLVGGRVRLRVIVLLAGVLALSAADTGAVGAVAPELRRVFGVSQTQLGLLTAVSSAVGAMLSVPMGALADRVVRVRLLLWTVLVWSAALVVGGSAPTYGWLLLSRVALGGAAAAAGPLLASLIGDLFPVLERATIYGWILTGEMIGAGVGLLVGGNIAVLTNWRFAFWLLAVLGGVVAWAVRRWLPEPARGGASRLQPNAAAVRFGRAAGFRRVSPAGDGQAGASGVPGMGADGGVTGPAGEGASDRSRHSVWEGFAYVLRTPTIRLLIVASAIGYFFFAGLRTFIVEFVEGYFGVGAARFTLLALIVGAAALVGVIAGGRITDRVIGRRLPTARVVVPAVAYTSAAVLFLPGLFVASLIVAIPLISAGAAMLAAANPPLDAARLDLVPATMWGRAESARTVLRLSAEAIAPLVFGVTADALAGNATRAGALRDTFALMLIPLVANGALAFRARHTYRRDVRAAERFDGSG